MLPPSRNRCAISTPDRVGGRLSPQGGVILTNSAELKLRYTSARRGWAAVCFSQSIISLTLAVASAMLESAAP